MVECPECGAGADLTPDGSRAHCATCMNYLSIHPFPISHLITASAPNCTYSPQTGNNIFEPGKEGSSEKGSGSGSGDKEQTKESTSETDKTGETGKS